MSIKEKIEYLRGQLKNYTFDGEPEDGEALVNHGICQGLGKAIRILEDDFDVNNDYNKKYTLEVIHKKNGQMCFNATNDGFHAFELLGFLEMKKIDIIKQIKGEIEPDIEYKRKVIKED